MPTPYTKKPCPGCGQIIKRSANSVCPTCRRILDRAATRKQAMEHMQTHYQVCTISDPAYWFYPYLPRLLNKQIGELFLQLTARPELNDLFFTMHYPERLPEYNDTARKPYHRLLDPETAYAVSAVHTVLQEALRDVYKKGVAHGQQALQQLARGELTLQEFQSKNFQSKNFQERNNSP